MTTPNLDARALDHKTLTEIRVRAVKAVQSGESPEDVAKTLGISRAAMYHWLALYRQGGWGALDARQRGGRPPRLDAKKLKWIFNTVTMKNPQQLKFEFALGTARMVGALIYHKFRMRLSKASVCRLLGHLGLTP